MGSSSTRSWWLRWGLSFFYKDNKTYLVVSDWGVNGAENVSKLFGYNINDRSLAFTIEGEITSVADITIDPTSGRVYLPEFTKNQVSIINLSKVIN